MRSIRLNPSAAMTPARRQLEAALKSSKAQGKRASYVRDARGVNRRSGEEAAYFNGLYADLEAGRISDFVDEPSFRIEIDGQWVCNVKADAGFTKAGRRHIVDWKGWKGDTAISRLKRRLVLACHKIEIELVGTYVEREEKKKAKRAGERALLKASTNALLAPSKKRK